MEIKTTALEMPGWDLTIHMPTACEIHAAPTFCPNCGLEIPLLEESECPGCGQVLDERRWR